MKRVMFSLLLAIAIAPEVWAQSWPNEPAGSSVLVDCNFNTPTCGVLADVYNAAQVTTDGTASFSPSSVLKQVYSAGSEYGGAQLDLYFNLSELYVGFWWKMNDDFEGFANNVNKLMFFPNSEAWHFIAAYGQPNTFPWSLNFFDENFTSFQNCHLYPYIDKFDCPNNSTGRILPNVNNVPLFKNTWYRIEVYIKRSTTNTSRDGILRTWINGQRVHDFTNVNTGQSNFWGYSLNHTWAGIDPTKTKTWIHYFDHLRVSATNGGGGGTPKGDTTPPAAPVNLRAQ